MINFTECGHFGPLSEMIFRSGTPKQHDISLQTQLTDHLLSYVTVGRYMVINV